MNGKYVDVNYILNEVSNNYPFISDISSSKVKEYIWKIVGRLGIEDALYDDVSSVDIENYRGNLPSNLYDFSNGMVREFDSKIQLTLISDAFYKSDNKSTFEVVTQVEANQEFDTTIPTDSNTQIYTYKLSENHIFTGFKDGKIEISYRAFPVDKFGDPLVPDNEKYISAVTSFIAERYAFQMMMTDMLSERKYDRLEQDYLFNVSSARSSNKIPDLTKMNSIRNRFHSTNDGSRMYDSGFRDYGSKSY
jgi:hypothetical protein